MVSISFESGSILYSSVFIFFVFVNRHMYQHLHCSFSCLACLSQIVFDMFICYISTVLGTDSLLFQINNKQANARFAHPCCHVIDVEATCRINWYELNSIGRA